MVIYKIENKNNNKVYIGQTNDFEQRKRAHKSTAFNPNNHSYDNPLYKDIRKYGWDNFSIIILEEFGDNKEYANEREIYYIEYYNSTNEKYGYNISPGGALQKKIPYEEKIKMSSIFTPEEIKDIQNRLRNGEDKISIREIYYPRLGKSYLDNINIGDNFYNEEWEYPLHSYKHDSRKYTRQQMKEIQEDIKNGMLYNDIHDKWNISNGLISLINNGQIWYNKDYIYPLSIRNNSRSQNANTWVKDVQNDLRTTNLSLKEIANKYQKAHSTIKKINSGASHRNNEYKYPLNKNKIK